MSTLNCALKNPVLLKIICLILKSDVMSHMVSPAMTPDLNPIEHVWNYLKQRMDDRTPPPTDLKELCAALVEDEELKTLLSCCHCSKWWKYLLLTWSFPVFGANFIIVFIFGY
uniref:Tc1-like transposase DDE domain-containing protein n=1 Tax=Oryzias latipes TaxID=8090 RepID=A0A3B3HDM3_ORYLA